MARVVMRAVRAGEVPPAGGTALQEDPGRPVFFGNGPDDYVCAQCGNVLAESMHDEQMTYRVRVKSRESGGTGHADADVTFALEDCGGTIHTHAQITGKAASMGEGVVVGVLDALIKDFTTKVGQI